MKKVLLIGFGWRIERGKRVARVGELCMRRVELLLRLTESRSDGGVAVAQIGGLVVRLLHARELFLQIGDVGLGIGDALLSGGERFPVRLEGRKCRRARFGRVPGSGRAYTRRPLRDFPVRLL